MPVECVPFAEVNEEWANDDHDESAGVAEKWQKNA
jgi:hypothetical protein